MNPVTFPQANSPMGPPEGMDESQVRTIPAYRVQVQGGNVDGAPIVVVAWRPTSDELAVINSGGPIFLSMLGGLATHYLSTSFVEAANPGMPALGSTGQAPDGKISADDEGEVRLAIGKERNFVALHFGKPIAWLAVPPKMAKEIAARIIRHAEELEG